MTDQHQGFSILKFYVWFIFLIPTFWGYTRGSNTIGQLFVSISLFLYAVGSILIYKYKIKLIKSYSILFFLQVAAYTLTLAIRQTDSFTNISFSDYSDLSRPILYLIAVCFPVSLKLKEEEIIKLVRIIVKVSLLISVFDIIKLFSWGEDIMKLYTPLDPTSFNYQRLSGTFAYCYNYGFILIFDLLFILYSFKRKLAWSILTIALIFLTGSRSVLIATFLAIVLYFILSNKSIISKIIIILSTIFLISVIYSLLSFIDIPIVKDIIDNIDKLLSIADNGISSDGSAATRSRQLDFVLENFSEYPLLGAGPQKESSVPIEIQLGYYLSSWGVIGLIIFLSSLFTALYYAYKSFHPNNNDCISFSKSNFIWISAGLFVGMSTPITDQIRVFQIYYFIQGLQFCIYLKSHKTDNTYTSATKLMT